MDKIKPLRILLNWRKYVRIIYRAIKSVIPDAEVYVIGGAAENRLTTMSDIDILVVLSEKPLFNEAVELRMKIMGKAEELGLPLYAPIELHIVGKEDLRKYVKKGKIIPANKL